MRAPKNIYIYIYVLGTYVGRVSNRPERKKKKVRIYIICIRLKRKDLFFFVMTTFLVISRYHVLSVYLSLLLRMMQKIERAPVSCVGMIPARSM